MLPIHSRLSVVNRLHFYISDHNIMSDSFWKESSEVKVRWGQISLQAGHFKRILKGFQTDIQDTSTDIHKHRKWCCSSKNIPSDHHSTLAKNHTLRTWFNDRMFNLNFRPSHSVVEYFLMPRTNLLSEYRFPKTSYCETLGLLQGTEMAG